MPARPSGRPKAKAKANARGAGTKRMAEARESALPEADAGARESHLKTYFKL